MARKSEPPSTFLWVLRGLTSAFLMGYLFLVYLAIFMYDWFPSGNPAENLLGFGLLLLAMLGYYLMWIRRELLAGILFIIWYAALWPAEILIGGDTFEDSPVPGILLFILGILLVLFRVGRVKKNRQ